MERCTLTIINRLGLHARAASKFVAVSSRYGCAVRVRRDASGGWSDGKSIMAVMMLAAGQGCDLEVETEGRDETAAMQALRDLVNDYFGEGG